MAHMALSTEKAPDLRPLAQQLKDARLASGMSLREAAEDLGMSVVALGEIERGKRPATQKMVDDIETTIRCQLAMRINPDGSPIRKKEP